MKAQAQAKCRVCGRKVKSFGDRCVGCMPDEMAAVYYEAIEAGAAHEDALEAANLADES